jgi:hypothetical protein
MRLWVLRFPDKCEAPANNMHRLIWAAVALLLPFTAKAALVSEGDYTLDTQTGLDWLNPALTSGLSYPSVLAGVGGWTNSGWRYATLAEVTSLFTHYVGPATTVPAGSFYSAVDPSYFNSAESLVLQLGPVTAFNDTRAPYNSTQYQGVVHQITVQGFFEGDTPGRAGLAEITAIYSDSTSSTPYGRWGAVADFEPDWDYGPWAGSLLVREDPSSVPEPSSSLALLLGAAGLSIVRKRRRVFRHSAAFMRRTSLRSLVGDQIIDQPTYSSRYCFTAAAAMSATTLMHTS